MGVKVNSLKKFLLDSDSVESKNYINNLLAGLSGRPEDEFIARHLGRDFWKELGYDD